jgi:putative transposase
MGSADPRPAGSVCAGDAELEALEIGQRSDLLAEPTPHLGPGVAAWDHVDLVLGQELVHRMYLWRAIDSEGENLDVLVQLRRDKAAAVKLLRTLLKKQGFAPSVLVTDKLPSYSAARRELGLSAHYEQGLRTNNRAGNSHQVVCRRERKMQGFKSPGAAQCFLAVHSAIHNTFDLPRP